MFLRFFVVLLGVTCVSCSGGALLGAGLSKKYKDSSFKKNRSENKDGKSNHTQKKLRELVKIGAAPYKIKSSIDRGENPNGFIGIYNYTSYAVKNGFYYTARALIQNGADVNGENKNGTITREIIEKSNSKEMRSLILELPD